jgi:WD40 repeat protein
MRVNIQRRVVRLVVIWMAVCLALILDARVTNAQSAQPDVICHDFIFHPTFSPDSHYLAVISGAERVILVWDTHTGQLIRRIGEEPTDVAFSPDSSNLVVSRHVGKTTIYNVNSGAALQTFDASYAPDIAYPNYVWAARFLPNNKYVLTADVKGTHLWDVKTGKQVRSYKSLYISKGEQTIGLAPDAQSMLLTRGPGFAIVSVTTGQELHRFETDNAYFSPDGKYLLTYTDASEYNEGVLIWDLEHNTQVYSFAGTQGEFSPDGKYVLTRLRMQGSGGYVTGLALWSMETGKLIREINEFDFEYGNATFSADSKSLLVYLGWKYDTEKSEYALEDILTGAVHYRGEFYNGLDKFLVSPDNHMVAIVSHNSYIYLRELSTGRELHQLCHDLVF